MAAASAAAGAAAPTRRRRRETTTTILLVLGCVAAVVRAEDPLINVYMRGSADRVRALGLSPCWHEEMGSLVNNRGELGHQKRRS